MDKGSHMKRWHAQAASSLQHHSSLLEASGEVGGKAGGKVGGLVLGGGSGEGLHQHHGATRTPEVITTIFSRRTRVTVGGVKRGKIGQRAGLEGRRREWAVRGSVGRRRRRRHARPSPHHLTSLPTHVFRLSVPSPTHPTHKQDCPPSW